MQQSLVVAIDGPSGSGKSTVSRRIAERLLGRYVDTGAMYRAFTWWVLERGIDPTDSAAVAGAAPTLRLQIGTDPRHPEISVDGVDVAAPIRSERVTAAVSFVAAVPQVREHLVAIQRALLAEAQVQNVSIVLEGRDIGSVVAPDADLKIWLTADPQVRAARRALEVAGPASGRKSADAAGDLSLSDSTMPPSTPIPSTATEAGLTRRDDLDAQRATSPAAPAPDAIELDATHLNADEVVAAVMDLLNSVTGRSGL